MFWAEQDKGTQVPPSGIPHWPETPPPPHVSGATQVPHWSKLPQPSPVGPQAMFWLTHVVGAQLPASGAPH